MMMFTAPMFLNTNLGIYRYIASPMEFYICPHACAWVPAFIQRRRVWAAPSCLTAMAIGRDHIGLVVKRLAALHVPKASCFFSSARIYIYYYPQCWQTHDLDHAQDGWPFWHQLHHAQVILIFWIYHDWLIMDQKLAWNPCRCLSC